MKLPSAEKLIADLLADPQKFEDDGRAYDLLQAYFAGFPVDTLRPLLTSGDRHVQRAAAFVASELGAGAAELVDDVIPLLAAGDRRLAYDAMEILTVCCTGERAAGMAHVALQLESSDDVLRALAMRLVGRADASQLEAAHDHLSSGGAGAGRETHRDGLRVLADGERVEPGVVVAMIGHDDPLVRRYGAIASHRLRKRFPALIDQVGASTDAELRSFHREEE